MKVDQFEASGSKEYFISYVSHDDLTLYGFCRLRFPNKENQIDEISGCALIRELHVYSTLAPVTTSTKDTKMLGGVQHQGIGKKLLEKAEQITRRNGYNKIAVISGVGVRNYYRKQGYELQNTYMIKDLIHNKNGGTYDWIEYYIELIICVWYLVLLILMIVFRKYIPNTQYL
jgi:elongator complex protein 3